MAATLQINAPGVPALISGASIVLPTLLTADAYTQYGVPVTPQWGIFLDGQPVITADTCSAMDYRQGWSLSDYPVERGGFETYDKVQLPYDVRLRFAAGGDESNRQALLASVEAVAGSLLLFDVVTPERTYTSCNVQHYDYRRTAQNGVGLIVVEVWLLEVRVLYNDQLDNTGTNGQPVDVNGNAVPQVSGQGPSDGTNTADPQGESPTNTGSVTPQDAPLSTQNAFDALISSFSGAGSAGF